MEKKMTKRDYFNAIKAVAGVADNADFVTFIDAQIAALDKKNAKTSGPSKEVLEFRAKVLDLFNETDGDLTVAAIAKELGATSQKVTPAVKALVESGDVVLKETVKRVKYYTAA